MSNKSKTQQRRHEGRGQRERYGVSSKSSRGLEDAVKRMSRFERRHSREAVELRRRQRAERKARLRERIKANPRLVAFHFRQVG